MLKRMFSVVLSLLMVVTMLEALPMKAFAAAYDETTYVTTGNQRDDIVAIARTQIGYREGNNSQQLDGTVAGSKNYTKYAVDLAAAKWGGSNPNHWCAYFVSWCAMRSNCLGKSVLYTPGCGNYVVKSKPFKKNGLGTLHGVKQFTYDNSYYVRAPYTIPKENYTPRKGDFVLFSYSANKIQHVGLVSSNYNSNTGTFTYIDGNCDNKVAERTIKLSDATVVAFYSPEYNESAGHYHLYSKSYDSAHPHQNFEKCGCGAKYYINSSYTKVASCGSCYPIGNAVLTRSFSKTAKTATFYRNNVANANSYTLSLYKNGSLYDSYSMTSTSYTVSNLASGSYTATLTAKNTNTGGTKTASCAPFTIVNSFEVSFDANGGSGAPAAQEKIKDEDLTLSTVTPTRAHYVFKGWAPTKTATEAVYEPGGTYTKDAKITLYAVWEPETYTVNFDANGGNGDLESVSITYGDTLRMPNAIVLSGSYLRGWGTSASTSTVSYRLGMDYKIDKNLNLYAVWAASAWANEIADSFAGGSGTEDDPYQISNASELAYLAHVVNSQTAAPEYQYYKLTDNIDLNFAEWVPIGLNEMENQYFYGSFDGNGFTISNMAISEHTAPYIGLFGYVKDSEIKNLNFIGEIYQVSSGEQMHIGVLTGFAKNSTISDCNAIYINVSGIDNTSAATNVEGFSNVGCIVGTQQGGVIKDCSADDCYMSLNSGSFNAGIIAGFSDGEITGNKVTAEENLFGTGNSLDSVCLGGIVGTSTGTVEKCSVNAGHMSSTIKTQGGASIGGIVGNLEGKIKLCSVQYTNQTKTDSVYAEGMTAETGTELGSVHMGGVAGYIGNAAELVDCKYDGMGMNAVGTNGDVGVGGIAGGIKTENDSFTIAAERFIDITTLPQKNGYKAKWYTDADFTAPYNFGTWVKSDLTLYAKWEKEEALPVWDGTSSEPSYDESTMTYTITSGEELAWVADVCKGIITTGTNLPSDKSFSGYTLVLANDIALNDTSAWELHENPGAGSNRSWKVIGNEANPFKGTFDGQGNTIYGIYSGTSGSSYLASSGLIMGKNTNSAVVLTNTYAYSDTLVDAVNSANSANISEDASCTETKPKTQITRLSFLQQVFGPTAYQSLDYLEEDETAVWVLKNGQLPEIYYNCLNDITISKEIEHGTITVDKTQAVDDEIVTITAVPDEGYEFNKFYVNGEEGVGTTFAVSGDSEIYAIFSPETAQYDVVLESNENASGSLSNADAVSTFSARSTSGGDSLTASDGEEILVSATSDEKYTIDSVCINGEEIAGNSFILTDDTTVSLTVTSIDTEVYAVTEDAENIGVYFADLSGSVINGDENTLKYIRYWETANPDVVFTTEVETGSGAYEAALDDLLPATSYSYQMLETGEVKTFTTLEDSDPPVEVNTGGLTTETTVTTDGTNYTFTVSASNAISTEIVYVAVYDENQRLLALGRASFDGSTSASVEIPVQAGAVLAKIFVWDENYLPLKDVELKALTTN